MSALSSTLNRSAIETARSAAASKPITTHAQTGTRGSSLGTEALLTAGAAEASAAEDIGQVFPLPYWDEPIEQDHPGTVIILFG